MVTLYQACRGARRECGILEVVDSISDTQMGLTDIDMFQLDQRGTPSYSFPAWTDFLFFYSTLPSKCKKTYIA